MDDERDASMYNSTSCAQCACKLGPKCVPELCYRTHGERLLAYIKILENRYPGSPYLSLTVPRNTKQREMLCSLFGSCTSCVVCSGERKDLSHVTNLKNNIYYGICDNCKDNGRILCPSTALDTKSCDAAGTDYINKVFLLSGIVLPEILGKILSDVLSLCPCWPH